MRCFYMFQFGMFDVILPISKIFVIKLCNKNEACNVPFILNAHRGEYNPALGTIIACMLQIFPHLILMVIRQGSCINAINVGVCVSSCLAH